jgi:hypothetical protein
MTDLRLQVVTIDIRLPDQRDDQAWLLIQKDDSVIRLET